MLFVNTELQCVFRECRDTRGTVRSSRERVVFALGTTRTRRVKKKNKVRLRFSGVEVV